MNLAPWRKPSTEVVRADPSISVDAYIDLLTQFSYQGITYTLPNAKQEEVGGTFASLARTAYKSNGPVFACILARQLLFSEARFQFRQIRNGRPGDLFGTSALAPLEVPWPGATTGDLLSRMLLYADLAGNAFVVRRRGGRLRLLRPDWVTLICASEEADTTAWDVDAEVIGYAYQPGGPSGGRDPVFFLAEEVAHFAPIPDPEARYRGMSWLTPVARELMADKATTEHKLKFFENGATPNLIVKLDVADLTEFEAWIAMFRKEHEGASNRGKTLFLSAAADATVVGSNMEEIDFKSVTGAGETRIASAARVPPIIVGFSEGLEAATYANYGQARRAFADLTMRPLWRNVAGSLARIIDVPERSELWYDGRDIAFLQEDMKDAAMIQSTEAQTIKQLVDAGFTPESVIEAVTASDFERLSHTGLFSVQLQPPGTSAQPALPAAPAPTGSNGNGRAEAYALMEGFTRGRELAPPPVTNHFTLEAAEPPRLEIAEGAVQVRVEAAPTPDVHVNVEAPPAAEPARVEFAEGAFVTTVAAPPPAEVNVTVEAGEPARVDFADGAIRVEAAPTPDINVTVEPASAPEVNVTVEAPPPAEVKVEAAPVPDVHVHLPDQRPRSAHAKKAADGSISVTYDENEEQA